MKILKLADQLKAIYEKHGDIEVMFTEPGHGSIFSVSSVMFVEAGKDEFPEDWDMPEGFKFVNLEN